MPSRIASLSPEPWILICGGFHTRGGMDRANLALAERLVDTGHPVYLVGHEISDSMAQRPGVTAIRVPRPAGSVLLGEARLARKGREISRRVKRTHANAITVANGGNGFAADVNWVHYVHHAAGFEDAGAPLHIRLKNRLAERVFRHHEKRAISGARLVVTNSALTRRHLLNFFAIEENRVITIYLGSNPEWDTPQAAERLAARGWLGIPRGVPVVVFVGALGHDRRKGFDVLWKAWQQLSSDSTWNAHLVVAGGGRQVEHWQREARKLDPKVHILGFTDRVRDLLAAADLLVSPAGYEPYGLNVQEAICQGVPAIVSADAGVAEIYPHELQKYLLSDPRDWHALAGMMKNWSRNIEPARRDFAALAERLRQRTWQTMADEFIAVVEDRLGRSSARDTLVAGR